MFFGVGLWYCFHVKLRFCMRFFSVCIDQGHRLNRISRVIPLAVHLTCLSKTCLKRDVWHLAVILFFYGWKNKDIQRRCQSSIIFGETRDTAGSVLPQILSPEWLPLSSIIWLKTVGMPSQKPHAMPQWFAIRCGHSIWWLKWFTFPLISLVFHPFKVN